MNESCRPGGHEWIRLEVAKEANEHIAYDRCWVCGTERQTVIEMDGTTGHVSYTYHAGPSPEDLATDLQALRTELQEEVIS